MPAGETCFQGRGKNVAIDITNIRKMVFGVNYLGANGGKVVKELWNSRFSPEEAYLIQGSLQEGPKDVFLRFCEEYKRTNEKLGLKQYLIPYLISSHPGSRLEDAIELALFLKEYGFIPDQVQDFYPTPGTLATCMFYTETDPFTGEPVYVAKDMEEKKMQRALIHYNKPENRSTVIAALKNFTAEGKYPDGLWK